MVRILLIILALLYCFFFLSRFVTTFTNVFLKKSLFFQTKAQIYVCIFYNFFFIFGFVFCFRFLRIFFIFNKYLDLNYFYNYWLENIYFIELFLILMFFFFCLKRLKFLLGYFIRFNFLRMYYYYYFRFETCRNFIFFVSCIEKNLYLRLQNKFYFSILYFFFKYAFKLFVFLFFIKNILFDCGVIYLGFLPYYGLYYLLFNFYLFFNCLVFDFDKASFNFYFQKEVSITLYGFHKLKLYHRYLLIGYSPYEFYDDYLYDVDFYIQGNFPKNWIFFPWYNYDIFRGLKKLKPNILNNQKFYSYIMKF